MQPISSFADDTETHRSDIANNFVSQSRDLHNAIFANNLHEHIWRSPCICRDEAIDQTQDPPRYMLQLAKGGESQEYSRAADLKWVGRSRDRYGRSLEARFELGLELYVRLA